MGWSERVVQTAIREIRAHDTLKENETRTGRWAASNLVPFNPAKHKSGSQGSQFLETCQEPVRARLCHSRSQL